jgi:(E)-4-hydroxy-3-methylbut-2-enyl-diphosphate synthase
MYLKKTENELRRKTREVAVGDKIVGGTNPIWVQSMTIPDTSDTPAVLEQIGRLEAADCEIIRVTVDDEQSLGAIPAIMNEMTVPLVADIHFRHVLALGAVEAGVHKVRINPGNIGGQERFVEVIKACKNKGTAMRVGVNAGSLERDIVEKWGYPCPPALVESALRHIETCESLGYDQVVVSLKSSDVNNCVEAYRLFSEQCDYPLHVGVTEAGMPPYGLTKSAMGIGHLLMDGIGDTIRVSLLADPVEEVHAGFDILKASGRRVNSPEVIACPTCGRLAIDLEKIVHEITAKLEGCTKPIKVSVLGCIVNGPGEAREADLGIAAGNGKGMIFRNGEKLYTVTEDEMVDKLLEEIDKFDLEADDVTARRRAQQEKAADQARAAGEKPDDNQPSFEV